MYMNIRWLEKKFPWWKKVSKFFPKRKSTVPPIATNMIVLKSRDVFAKQIADTIKRNTVEQNSKEKKESFILGISGKWGEGKTTLLTKLAKKLRPEYKVVDINP